jgi:proteasome lid subunit RPN8/RPN11
LRAGETFRHRVYILPQTENDPVPTAGTDVESEETVPLKLKRAAIVRRLDGAGRLCPAAWNDLDFPLFVKPEVLAEATALAQSAGEWEIGGILVGYLHRDTDSPEVYAEITAQIPAALADAGHTYLGFTPQAWAAVSDALALRDLQEIILGWWHYHPFFCRHCDLARRHHCLLSRPFFSRDDQELHRVVFDTAFSVALLLSDIGEASLCCDWFGWRCGAVETRGCYLLNEYHSNPDDHPTESHSTATHTANAREHPHEQ